MPQGRKSGSAMRPRRGRCTKMGTKRCVTLGGRKRSSCASGSAARSSSDGRSSPPSRAPPPKPDHRSARNTKRRGAPVKSASCSCARRPHQNGNFRRSEDPAALDRLGWRLRAFDIKSPLRSTAFKSLAPAELRKSLTAFREAGLLAEPAQIRWCQRSRQGEVVQVRRRAFPDFRRGCRGRGRIPSSGHHFKERRYHPDCAIFAAHPDRV
jgi:hypothetical protein